MAKPVSRPKEEERKDRTRKKSEKRAQDRRDIKLPCHKRSEKCKKATKDEKTKENVKRNKSKKFAKLRVFRDHHYHPHKSFRRSYREDYLRETKVTGILDHVMGTFRLIFKNFKVFLPFIILMVAAYIVLVGLMSEEFYQQYQDSITEASETEGAAKIGVFARAALLLSSTVTTGGLDSGMDEVGRSFMIILFLVMWLVTIYYVRHFMAGHKPKMRDGLYNALTPLISTFAVLIIVFIQAIPLMLVLITYSAAVATGFLSTPFYALLYFIFAMVMLLISIYCFSSSLIALAAVTAPGVYPVAALSTASDLVMGRRLHFIARLVALLITVVLVYIIVMMPVILLDFWLKGSFEWLSGVPIVPFMLLVCTCFIFVYAATYIYQYYRWLLDYEEK